MAPRFPCRTITKFEHARIDRSRWAGWHTAPRGATTAPRELGWLAAGWRDATVAANLRGSILEYLPRPVPMTPVMEEMAQSFQSDQWVKVPEQYGPMQSAYFIRPRSPKHHQKRRDASPPRIAEAKSDGFVVPEVFREILETDAYVDRVHRTTAWLEIPTELCDFRVATRRHWQPA